MTLLRGYLAPRGGWTEAHAGLSADHGGRNQLGLRSASRVCEILRDEPLRQTGAEDAIVIAGEGPAAHRGGCYHIPRAMVFRGRLAGDEESPRGGFTGIGLGKLHWLRQWLLHRRLTIFSKTSVC